jgi:hypothetical protein
MMQRLGVINMKQRIMFNELQLERPVQSAITSVSFPDTLERLRAMGTKWLGLVGKDWITDMDLLMDFPEGRNIPWIAPKWLTSGDILFFYHTKRSKILIDKLLIQAKRLATGYATDALVTMNDAKILIGILQRQATLANLYSGAIFGYAEVSGRPQRAFDDNKHFKGTIYAPLDVFHVFEHPLKAEQFADTLRIGQNTITPMWGDQFEAIKGKLRLENRLPISLENTKPSGLGFRDVNAKNWMQISCNKDVRFINEAQLRSYLIDYLLEDIKDPRTPIYTECDCYRNGERTGIADYFIKLGDTWLPVEAKLNLLTEQDIFSQVEKYIHIDSFRPTIKGLGEGIINSGKLHSCMVIDQAGIYFIKDRQCVDCSPDKPAYKREDFPNAGIGTLRNQIYCLVRG